MNGARVTVGERLADARTKIRRLTPEQAAEAQAAGAVIVDTRDSADRLREGVVPGSLRITRDTLEWRADPTAELPDPVVSDFGNDIIVICNDGYGSSLAADSLLMLGHATVADVIGGYRAWKRAGLPTEPAGPAQYDRAVDVVRSELAHDPTVDITTTGRRTGLRRRLEIWMVDVDGRFFITGTTGRRDWIANLSADPSLVVHLKQHAHVDLAATATPVDDEATRRAVFEHANSEWYRTQEPLEVLVERAPLVEVRFEAPPESSR